MVAAVQGGGHHLQVDTVRRGAHTQRKRSGSQTRIECVDAIHNGVFHVLPHKWSFLVLRAWARAYACELDVAAVDAQVGAHLVAARKYWRKYCTYVAVDVNTHTVHVASTVGSGSVVQEHVAYMDDLWTLLQLQALLGVNAARLATVLQRVM